MSSANESQPKDTARILLVDDNKHGLIARRTVLEEQGYSITSASDAKEALELFSSTRFDLIVTDYKMPRMDGVELIGKIRASNAAIPVILISGFVEALGLSEANTGADAVIQKSANEVSHLLRTVGRLLRKNVPKKPPLSQSAHNRLRRKTV